MSRKTKAATVSQSYKQLIMGPIITGIFMVGGIVATEALNDPPAPRNISCPAELKAISEIYAANPTADIEINDPELERRCNVDEFIDSLERARQATQPTAVAPPR